MPGRTLYKPVSVVALSLPEDLKHFVSDLKKRNYAVVGPNLFKGQVSGRLGRIPPLFASACSSRTLSRCTFRKWYRYRCLHYHNTHNTHDITCNIHLTLHFLVEQNASCISFSMILYQPQSCFILFSIFSVLRLVLFQLLIFFYIIELFYLDLFSPASQCAVFLLFSFIYFFSCWLSRFAILRCAKVKYLIVTNNRR